MENEIKFGDVLFFIEDTAVYTADNKWIYNKNIQRIIYNDEPLIYLKCHKTHGNLYHYFSSLGLKYVFKGPYSAFKRGLKEQFNIEFDKVDNAG